MDGREEGINKQAKAKREKVSAPSIHPERQVERVSVAEREKGRLLWYFALFV